MTERKARCAKGVFGKRGGCLVVNVAALVYGGPWISPAAADGEGWAHSIQIPVIVNIYSNSVDPQDVKDAIEEANQLLKNKNRNGKSVDMKLVVVKANNPPGAGNGDDDGNGEFTEAERKKLLEFGGKELKEFNKPKGNKKGIKLSFGQTPEAEDARTVGLAHPVKWGDNWPAGRPGNPTILLRYTDDADTGNTIAHELGHVMGIEGDYDDGDYVMDGQGRGSEFKDSEITQMRKYEYRFGKCSTQWKRHMPAIKDKPGRAGR